MMYRVTIKQNYNDITGTFDSIDALTRFVSDLMEHFYDVSVNIELIPPHTNN